MVDVQKLQGLAPPEDTQKRQTILFYQILHHLMLLLSNDVLTMDPTFL
jgi:hypothetical protein